MNKDKLVAQNKVPLSASDRQSVWVHSGLWGRKHQPAVFETDSAESTQINHVANDDDEEWRRCERYALARLGQGRLPGLG
jgi:hypothetical protein